MPTITSGEQSAFGPYTPYFKEPSMNSNYILTAAIYTLSAQCVRPNHSGTRRPRRPAHNAAGAAGGR